MRGSCLPRGMQPFRSTSKQHRTACRRSAWPLRGDRPDPDQVPGPGPGSAAQQACAASPHMSTQHLIPRHRHRRARCLSTAATAGISPPVAAKPITANPPHASSRPTSTDSAASFEPPARMYAHATNPQSSLASPPAGDLRLNLWLSLLQASAAQLTAATAAAAAAASGAAVRLQRLSQPPPLNFPPGPTGDQTFALLSDPLTFLSSSTAQYGSMVGLLLGGERVVLVTGREEARAVLVEQAGTVYVKEGTAFFPGSSLAGNGLLVSDGAVWQRQRRLSNRAFRRAAVEAYSSAMVAATTDMLQHEWAAGGTRDVYADFNELTLRVTLEALFGFGAAERDQRRQLGGEGAVAVAAGQPSPPSPSSTGSYEAQQIVTAVEKAFTFFTQRAATGFVIPEWLPTWDNLEFAAAVQQLDRVVYGMIARRREELAQAHGSVAAAAAAAAAADGGGSAAAVPSDLLTSLLLSRDDDGSGMSDVALRDELMTLLVAGQETSAILLGWAAALLAAHPEVATRAAAEVAAVCGGRESAPPSAASIRHMPYMESVLLETLRLYSPAYMVGRCARVDAALGPYSLPAGTTVLVSPYVMHRDAAVWEHPDEFRPERWHPLQSREGYPGYMGLMSNLGPNGAYLPFGGGPRNCIGTGFAMTEALLVLAAVLQSYSLQLPSAAAAAGPAAASFPKPKPLLTLRPEAVVLRIMPR